MPTALITGISGQDGHYLGEFLDHQGYRVVGTTRGSGTGKYVQTSPMAVPIEVVKADLLDQKALESLISRYEPNEVYNLAGDTYLPLTLQDPVSVGETVALGVTRILEAIRCVNPAIRFFQASSSEMFGAVTAAPQAEETPYQPRYAYGVAKVYGHLMTRYYREHRGVFACSGILYNHESPRRGREFVFRKITHGAASIKLGLAKTLHLGNLDARRDWGFAGDYVEAMWRMLQHPDPDDFVLATGELHSVQEICEIAFSHLGLPYLDHVISEPDPSRPPEGIPLVGNADKAKRLLGWKPKVTFRELVSMMVEADLATLRKN